jgi:hypothetical protein
MWPCIVSQIPTCRVTVDHQVLAIASAKTGSELRLTIVRNREKFATPREVINCRNRAITLTAPGYPDVICGVLFAVQAREYVPLSV